MIIKFSDIIESKNASTEKIDIKDEEKNKFFSWVKYYFGVRNRIKSKLNNYIKLHIDLAKSEVKKQQEILNRSDPKNQEVLNNEIRILKDSIVSIEQELVYDIGKIDLPKNYIDKIKSFKDSEFLKARIYYRKIKLALTKAQKTNQELANYEKSIAKSQEELNKKEESINDFDKKITDKLKELNVK